MKKSSKKFLKLPEYPGGKDEFKRYIKENLIYPREALNKRVEGVVYINAEINDNGDVLRVWVEKGIGAGCDDEAIRLIKNIHFGEVRNRKVRVKTKKRFRIEFKLPPQKRINYNFVKTKFVEIKTVKTETYSYAIKLK